MKNADSWVRVGVVVIELRLNIEGDAMLVGTESTRTRTTAQAVGRSVVVAVAGLALAALSGCGAEDPAPGGEASACMYTYECAQGFICVERRCEQPIFDDDVPLPPDETPPDDPENPGDPEIPGEGEDGDDDRVTFGEPHYRTCKTSADCSVFGGTCLTTLVLSQPDLDGTDRVAVSTLHPEIPVGTGICGTVCTNDPRVCEGIPTGAKSGVSAAFECQVVYRGQNPYDVAQTNAPSQSLPFDALIDFDAMGAGVAFASVCRPPFAFAKARSESFCARCSVSADCVDEAAVCYLEKGGAQPPSGACVEPCAGDADCPFGFACGPYGAAQDTYCLPIGETCGRCADYDGDRRGVGVCGPVNNPIRGVDCDDRDATTYFNGRRSTHAFALVDACGSLDRNCNGVRDDAELLGSTAHCSACGDNCMNDAPNAVRACLQDEGGAFACSFECLPSFVNCDADDGNGCETPLRADMIYYRDADGDGAGSNRAEDRAVFCTPQKAAQALGTWVQNNVDCNDADPSVHGAYNACRGDEATEGERIACAARSFAGHVEWCDNVDNNCDGTIDENAALAGLGSECVSDLPGVCSRGLATCGTPCANTRTAQCRDTAPRPPVVPPGASPDTAPGLACVAVITLDDVKDAVERCDGLDHDCDGTPGNVDYGAENQCPADAFGICADGKYACQDNGAGYQRVCVAGDPLPDDPLDDARIDSNCDGMDGVREEVVFVSPAGEGTFDGDDATGNGTILMPYATLGRALVDACAVQNRTAGRCKPVVMREGVHVVTTDTVIPSLPLPANGRPPVLIRGGYTVDFSQCTNQSCEPALVESSERTRLVREAPAMLNLSAPGARYAALQGDSAASNTIPMHLELQNIDLQVRAPAYDRLTAASPHAPTQIGIECPLAGCGTLRVWNVAIQVDAALDGMTPATPPRAESTYNGRSGRRGCDGFNKGACGVQVPMAANGPWGLRANRTSDHFGGPSVTCADPETQSGRGGSPSMRTYYANADNTFVYQQEHTDTVPQWSASNGYRANVRAGNPRIGTRRSQVSNQWDARGTSAGLGGYMFRRVTGQYPWVRSSPLVTFEQSSARRIPLVEPVTNYHASAATPGRDGFQGDASYYDENSAPLLLWSSGGAISLRPRPPNAARSGLPGGGGGGGAGCVEATNSVKAGGVSVNTLDLCYHDSSSHGNKNWMGGGGGSGGCGGLGGAQGGVGGSAIGILLIGSGVSCTTDRLQCTQLLLHDGVPITAATVDTVFRMDIGAAGNGAKGGTGQDGYKGGDGGGATISDPGNGAPHFRAVQQLAVGAFGGDGGGGGAGAGGAGGSAIAVLRVSRGSIVPDISAILGAFAGQAITVPPTAGTGGTLGAPGAWTRDPSRADGLGNNPWNEEVVVAGVPARGTGPAGIVHRFHTLTDLP